MPLDRTYGPNPAEGVHVPERDGGEPGGFRASGPAPDAGLETLLPPGSLGLRTPAQDPPRQGAEGTVTFDLVLDLAALERATAAPLLPGVPGARDPLDGLVADHPALGTLLDAVGLGVMRWDLESGAVAWSDAAYRVHGRARWRRVRQGTDGTDSIHPDDRVRVVSEWEALRDTELNRPPDTGVVGMGDDSVHRWTTLTYRSYRDDHSVGYVRCDAIVTIVERSPVLVAVCTDVTDVRTTSDALQDRLDFVHGMLASTPDTVLVYDLRTHTVVEQPVTDQPSWPQHVHPEDAPAHRQWFARTSALQDDEVAVVTARLSAEDGWAWHEARATVFRRDESGAVAQVLILLRRVHEEAESARLLAESEQRFRTLFDRAPVGEAIIDADGRFLEVNDALCELLGRPREDLLATVFEAVVHPQHRSEALADRGAALANLGESGNIERRLVHAAGHDLWCRVRSVPIDLDDAPRILVSFGDITETKATEQTLRHEAMHDQLTGLPNRRLLIDRLDTALARARRSGSRVAVYFIDVDDLKGVNDSLGHDAGDIALVEMTRALRGVLREPDTLGRLAGDEFVAVCEDVGTEAEAGEVARRLGAAARRTISISGRQVEMSASVGVALSRADTDTAQEILRRSDAAMYVAKSQGSAGSSDLSVLRGSRTELDQDLRRALADNKLELHYQPVVGLDGLLRGVEALLRWPHPERGTVPAADLLDLLEAGDVASPLALWAVRRAVADLAEAGLGGMPVRVNVPARALLRPQLGHEVARVLAVYGRNPSSLVLEVREADVGRLLRRGSSIRGLDTSGASLGLDRFGADTAPLATLRRLPLRTVALDRSLISAAVDRSADADLLQGIVAAARSLGIVTIALAIATDDALAVARGVGVDALQGFRIAAPAPLESLLPLVRAGGVDLG